MAKFFLRVPFVVSRDKKNFLAFSPHPFGVCSPHTAGVFWWIFNPINIFFSKVTHMNCKIVYGFSSKQHQKICKQLKWTFFSHFFSHTDAEARSYFATQKSMRFNFPSLIHSVMCIIPLWQSRTTARDDTVAILQLYESKWINCTGKKDDRWAFKCRQEILSS